MIAAIDDGHGVAHDLLDAVQETSPAGQAYYPLLRGPKVSPMWVRMLANPGGAVVEGIEAVPVAVDVQVRRITENLGVADTRDLDPETARPVIQAAWTAAVAEAGFGGPDRIAGTCAALDPALWFYAKWGCSHCEGLGRQVPIGRACEACSPGAETR